MDFKKKKLKLDVKTSEDPALLNVNGYSWEDKEREGMQVMKEKVGSSVEAECDGGEDGTDAAEQPNQEDETWRLSLLMFSAWLMLLRDVWVSVTEQEKK